MKGNEEKTNLKSMVSSFFPKKEALLEFSHEYMDIYFGTKCLLVLVSITNSYTSEHMNTESGHNVRYILGQFQIKPFFAAELLLQAVSFSFSDSCCVHHVHLHNGRKTGGMCVTLFASKPEFSLPKAKLLFDRISFEPYPNSLLVTTTIITSPLIVAL